MKDDKAYLAHVKDCIDDIRQFNAAGKIAFLSDKKTKLGTLLLLQNMTESLSQLSDAVKTRHAEIPWFKIRGFRNILVHDYLGGIDDDMVWNVVEYELDSIYKMVCKELKVSK